ncbi:MAG: HAD-IC family P-type ATPase [Candidatus Methanoplasma sp.]|jgi:cation-transporting ATPase E|nr:HAD-IC family P-type ATPase [Candidatus Methanoplasma sp.]
MEPRGLTGEEVRARISEGKVNKFESRVSRSYLDIIVKNVCTTFNLILIIVGAALLYFDEPISALSATGVIALNVLISTVQEMRAKRRLDKIALLLRPTVHVIRNGEETKIDPSEIVLDDIIRLSSGDQAQVDGELITSASLEMDESLLTGESRSVRKHIGDTVHSGAFCVTGSGYYKVTALGEDTLASKMLVSAKKYNRKNTPLQRETSTVTKMLMLTAFIFLLILAAINFLGGGTAKLFAIKSVLVLDIVPIALFLLITITYMIAAVRMANGGVLLQNSNSVESMSHVDTVCMDKTGTITTNNLVYNDMETFVDRNEAELSVRLFVHATGSKNTTVKALEKAFGCEGSVLEEEVQFSSERKYSAVRISYGGTSRSLFVGAWSVLKDHVGNTDITERISELSRKGLRTVVLCGGPGSEIYSGDEPVIPKLELIALISIRDEVRPDCRAIIEDFQKSGMDLKVISGDDPETVNALFSLAEIPGDRRIISGDELAALSEKEFEEAALGTNIFGRMKPEQKEMVVASLKKNGRYVAMVGDGVNDVRSLKAANVGIALQSGSGAARGVADMVLVDDRFSALPKAIVEGKRTVTGMRDILRLYLTRNFVLAAVVGVLLLALGRVPMLPVHNAFYALASVSFAAFFMAIWARPSNNRTLILPGVLRFSIPMAVLIAGFGFGIYAVFLFCTGNGSFDLGYDFYHSMYEGYDGPSMWSDWNGFWEHMSLDGERYEDVTARNAMLIFLMLAGIAQLFFIYPLARFYSVGGEVSRDLKPTLLALLLFGLVALVYLVPQVAVEVASLALFPPAYHLLILGFVAVWFLSAVLFLKSRFMRKVSDAAESAYRRSLETEIGKEK